MYATVHLVFLESTNMRINEIVAKMEPTSSFDRARSFGQKAFSPSKWFAKDKKDGEDLAQNPFGFLMGRNAVDLVLNKSQLYPQDVKNLKVIIGQVESGVMKPSSLINTNVLLSALRSGLANRPLTPEETKALGAFRKQFH